MWTPRVGGRLTEQKLAAERVAYAQWMASGRDGEAPGGDGSSDEELEDQVCVRTKKGLELVGPMVTPSGSVDGVLLPYSSTVHVPRVRPRQG